MHVLELCRVGRGCDGLLFNAQVVHTRAKCFRISSSQFEVFGRYIFRTSESHGSLEENQSGGLFGLLEGTHEILNACSSNFTVLTLERVFTGKRVYVPSLWLKRSATWCSNGDRTVVTASTPERLAY